MPFGITSEGFIPKTLTDLKSEIGQDIKDAFGAGFEVDNAPTLIAQLIGIVSDKLAECWEIAQATSSLDPDAKEGADLIALCALTGTIPLDPVASTVTLSLTGTNGTVIPSGSTVSVDGSGRKFDTGAEATLATASLWVTLTPYAAGDTVRTAATRCYRCVIAGTSGATNPTGTDTEITDGTVTWAYIGEGAAFADVAAASQELDAVPAPAFTITTIETPVSGWSNSTNVLDAALGRAVETDADLRARRIVELAGGGAGTADEIRAALLDEDNVPGVLSVHIFNNVTDTTDGDGVPPHSIEALVRGGVDQDVGDTLFAHVGAGIRAYGSTPVTVVDSEGNDQSVSFSRPTEVPIYVDVGITALESLYPADGDAQVKAAVAAAIDALGVGWDVFASALYPAVFSVAGVIRVDNLFVGTAPAPVGSSVTITSHQLATGDTSRVDVDGSFGTP